MAAKRKKGHKKSHKGGHVPLAILERRLHKLAAIVAKRGGRKGGARKK